MFRRSASIGILAVIFSASPVAFAQQPLGENLQNINDHSQHASNSQRTPALSVTPDGIEDFKLVAGAAIEVTVFEESDLNGSYRLDNSGNIVMPLAGRIALRNLTLRQAEEAISSALIQQQVLKVAHVVVNLNEYTTKNFTVLGEVAAPARYPALAPRPLIDVLAMAGGETAVAGDRILIHRDGTSPEQVDTVLFSKYTSQSVLERTIVSPGDTVTVPRAGIVYVVGSVNRPGGYVLQESGTLNVLQAVALALGTAPVAATKKMRLLRRSPDGSTQIFAINWEDVNKGKEQPMALRGEDILFVPSSTLKSIFIQGNGLVTGVAAAAASASIYR